ncbi:hypothetical protein BASA81_000444 [Batrachochytrium salamandrivorans]|nr:hypothetical protein BASA81_000444 [Batrachochytrium salamandrivorans]
MSSLGDVSEYVKSIARGDLDREVAVKGPEHLAVLALHDALFCGRKKDAPPSASAFALARRKRGLDSAAMFQGPASTLLSVARPCSPSMFQQTDSRKRAKSNAGGGEMDETLSAVSQLLYVQDKSGAVDDDKLLPPLRANSLGAVLLPIRRKSVLEKWSLHEISIFESAIALHGKRFDLISPLFAAPQKKTTGEVIEFYYAWKNSAHAKAWKDTYKGEEEEDGHN